MSLRTLYARRVVAVGRRLYQRQLIAGSDGNISTRMSENEIIITPAGRSKGFLSPEDLVTIDREGRRLKGRFPASSEAALHLYIYARRPDVKACVHAHPPYATAFAVAGLALDEKILPEAVLFIGQVPLAPYAPPGTEQVGRSIEPWVADRQAFLLKNHGVVTVGRTLEEACDRLETVEHLARVIFLARQLGRVDCLGDKEISRLEKIALEQDKTSLPPLR